MTVLGAMNTVQAYKEYDAAKANGTATFSDGMKVAVSALLTVVTGVCAVSAATKVKARVKADGVGAKVKASAQKLMSGNNKGGSYSSLRDLMSPKEAARYDKYWNNVADDMLKNDLNSYRQAVLNKKITKTTGGTIRSKVVTAAIDTNTGDIYHGVSYNLHNPTNNAINPRMQAILDTATGSMKNYSLDNCGEFNAINNALNNGADINALRVYSIERISGRYKPPCDNCQYLYGNLVQFIE